MELKEVDDVLQTLEKYGIRTVDQARNFVKIADNEGITYQQMAQNRSATLAYAAVQRTIAVLGKGRFKHTPGPELVLTKKAKSVKSAKSEEERYARIVLSAKGKRLVTALKRLKAKKGK